MTNHSPKHEDEPKPTLSNPIQNEEMEVEDIDQPKLIEPETMIIETPPHEEELVSAPQDIVM